MERAISFSIELAAPVRSVWDAWTTPEGIRSFFAPDCNIELKVDGKYEVFFDVEKPYGLMGSEGMRVMAIEPLRMLSFTWNAPPEIPTIRGQRTQVALYFEPLGAEKTKLTLINCGYGTSPDWQKTREYFERAWSKVVLPRLAQYMDGKPQVWDE